MVHECSKKVLEGSIRFKKFKESSTRFKKDSKLRRLWREISMGSQVQSKGTDTGHQNIRLLGKMFKEILVIL